MIMTKTVLERPQAENKDCTVRLILLNKMTTDSEPQNTMHRISMYLSYAWYS